MGKYDLAEQTFLECLPGLRQRNSGKWWKNYFEAQYELSQKQGNYPRALNAFKKYKSIEDSLFNQRLQSEIIEMQILNETKEKEQKILLLQTKNELAQTEIHFQRKILVISIITLFFFTILLGFIYRQYLSRNKAYKKLFEKNRALIDYENKYNQQIQNNKALHEPNAPTRLLKQTERERIIQKLEQLIEGKKLFLSKDLSLNQLCKKLQTNSAYLSQVINQEYGKNINSYINEYRIKEVQCCMINGEHKTLTIEGIASKAGFKTRATFNTAFKKVTGITPSFYINSLEQGNLSNKA
jgi:AraC-like DNA-binding protein